MNLRACVFSAITALALPAAADQVHFTGQTTASRTLIVDTLHNVILLGQGRFNCPSVEAVEAVFIASIRIEPMFMAISNGSGCTLSRDQRQSATLAAGRERPL